MTANLFKRDSMREPPQLGNGYLLARAIGDRNNVKMPLTRGQSAWVQNPSETTRRAFTNAHSFSNCANFNDWLVGFTDGDGCFYFSKTNRGNWAFSFQISQSCYNLRALYFIKSQLKVGSINIDKKSRMAEFRVRNRTHLVKHIIPIFDKHPLLTNKYFNFECFKKALTIYTNSELSREKKDALVSGLKIKSLTILQAYESPAWKNIKKPLCASTRSDVLKVMSKSWIIGFTEAEGSFYIVKKDAKRLVHAFEITQKGSRIVLEAVAIIFDLKVTDKKTYSTVVTINSQKIQKIADYFFKTMKGMKSLEYRIWSRSFAKNRGDFQALHKIREQMRNIRNLRFGKQHFEHFDK